MDFSKLGPPKGPARPVDPIKIFEQLPNLPGTPNDLWRGQAEALLRWHQSRTERDILISLNTGAGKTLVGILIAQSLANEGVANVVYVCATIDLVRQTSQEATAIGLEHTTRIRADYDNDLFESGKSFCITTCHALFNGLSAIRRRHFPGAVIFDDAHVAETILRGTLTLQISSENHPDLFGGLIELFRPHFRDLHSSGRFNDSLSPRGAIVMAAPGGLAERAERIAALLEAYGASTDDQLKYVFAHIRDKIRYCAALFGRGRFELAPPFLPSLALDVFERPIRRIYLSATLRSRSDFVRAFGRLPHIAIEPDNDAGNGERLILFGRQIPDGITPKLVATVSQSRKALIAVPSYSAAQAWSDLAEPPAPAEFSEKLNEFRALDSGAVILVSRVDGIDLPHDTCRVMVLDGLPSGSSLIETYQWEFLRMGNLHATRLANRLVQLFGRINRGRNDYGVFLISGSDINSWLNNDRYVALLPELIQRQVTLGRLVQEGMGIKTTEAVLTVIDAIISREPSWLDFYGNNIKRDDLDQEQVARADEAEPQMVSAALAEALYAAAIWNGDVGEARRALDDAIEGTGRVDPLLAGWQSVWLGAALELEGDLESALLSYRRAISRLGNAMALRRGAGRPSAEGVGEDASAFCREVDRLVGSRS